jgi:hypothetical protein
VTGPRRHGRSEERPQLRGRTRRCHQEDTGEDNTPPGEQKKSD